MHKVLLIGQAPANALGKPVIEGLSRGLLAKLSGLMEEQFLLRFEAMNVLQAFPGKAAKKGDRFPMKKAREAATAMLPQLEGRVIVFLGRAVQKAFKQQGDAFQWGFMNINGKLTKAAMCPHPSGINLFWNLNKNKSAGARFFGELVKTIDDMNMKGEGDGSAAAAETNSSETIADA